MTERELVERCQQGDRDAQQELYAQSSDRIYRLLLRMTHNHDDALDLAQSVYVRAFQNIHQFNGTASLGSWVYRIAVNEALQWMRSEKRRCLRLMKRQQESHVCQQAEAADVRLDVEEALTRLSDDERALIVLRHFEELSYAEMAEVLNKPSGTIGSELNRARQRLRGLLAPETSPTP